MRATNSQMYKYLSSSTNAKIKLQQEPTETENQTSTTILNLGKRTSAFLWFSAAHAHLHAAVATLLSVLGPCHVKLPQVHFCEL